MTTTGRRSYVGKMGHRPRAFLWASIALVVAVLAGGAMPRGLRSPVDAPGLIGYLYVNEGTADRNDPEARGSCRRAARRVYNRRLSPRGDS